MKHKNDETTVNPKKETISGEDTFPESPQTPVFEKEEATSQDRAEACNEELLTQMGEFRRLLSSGFRGQLQLAQSTLTELQTIKNESYKDAIQKPCVEGCITLFDLVFNETKRLETSRPAGNESQSAFVEVMYDNIVELLKGFGVTQIRSTSTSVNPSCQRIVGTRVSRTQPASQVCEVIRCGWEKDGRILRYEEVIATIIEKGTVS